MNLKEEIKKAYLQLKGDVYYDYSNLFLRETIARFEKNNFNDSLLRCSNEIINYLSNPSKNQVWLQTQLETIDTFLLPKRLIKGDKNGEGSDKTELIINNVREEEKYSIQDVFFYFNGNITLYILSTLWCRIVGRILDEGLSNDVYGNRLYQAYENDKGQSNYSNLFKKYYTQYSKWRDQAVDESLHQLEQKRNVILIALDMKQCYHRLEVDWSAIDNYLEKKTPSENIDLELGKTLNRVVKDIHEKYHSKTGNFLLLTIFQSDLNIEEKMPVGLPIGLPSSSILANWELRRLDSCIAEKLRPIYYGRYVDDLLIVLNVPKSNIKQQSRNDILDKYFVDTGIFDVKDDCQKTKPTTTDSHNSSAVSYHVKKYPFLIIRSDKIVVHYYQYDHSWAGLKQFKEEIKNRASEFRFLPTEDEYKELSDEAYDLQYDGSIYNFRSLIGITENPNKLMQFIYKQQLKAWLCSKKLEAKTIRDIFLFYKGTNILNYLRTWEKLFTLFLVTNKEKEFRTLEKVVDKTIRRIWYVGEFRSEGTNTDVPEHKIQDDISEKIKADTRHFLDLAIAMAVGYLNQMDISLYIKEENNKDLPIWFRSALLLRHQNIVWPLLDYTDYKGSLVLLNLTEFLTKENPSIDLEEEKIQRSTRFIHPDEILLFWFFSRLLKIDGKGNKSDDTTPFYSHPIIFEKPDQESNPTHTTLNEPPSYLPLKPIDFPYPDLLPEQKGINQEMPNGNKPVTILESSFPKDTWHEPDRLCIGIANVEIDKNRFNQCIKSSNPLLDDYKKQNTLFTLLNTAEEEPKCNLVVFPEMYIPFGWLPFMAAQARRRQIGLVFGVEHVNIGGKSLNLVATMLPYKDKNNWHRLYLSLRLKNYYSPREAFELCRLSLERPDLPFLYEKFHWHGAVFTVFNCFELTDLLHRGLFRSDIDFIVIVENNKDINYYSNLLEATSRDVHCFAIQANTSDFGDSRITSPKPTEEMNLVRVKGGDNSVLLKAHLPITDLRDFQMKKYSPVDNRYKPTPAGYNHLRVRKRR